MRGAGAVLLTRQQQAKQERQKVEMEMLRRKMGRA
jgi:hypothetical protein